MFYGRVWGNTLEMPERDPKEELAGMTVEALAEYTTALLKPVE